MIHLKELPLESEPNESRKPLLQRVVDHVALQRTRMDSSDLIFICTHNSRRSHLAAIWASVAAHHYGAEDVRCWSGGTEATAFHPNAVASLKRSGFTISDSAGNNPKYEVSFAPDANALICFSKVYDDPYNPQEEIAAIMVCDHAEQNCPFIPGALARIPIPYRDPKESDGTDIENETYDARSGEIAAEMFWIFRQLGNAGG